MSKNHDFQSATRLTYAAILMAVLGTGAWSTAAMAGDHKGHDSPATEHQAGAMCGFEDLDSDGDAASAAFDPLPARPEARAI